MATRAKRSRNRAPKRRTPTTKRRTPTRAATKSAPSRSRRRVALVKRGDVVDFLAEQAVRIAAPDVTALVAQAPAIRAKAGTLDGERFHALRGQIAEALACVEDYAAGRCPQIPYYTVALLATALFYFQTAVDVLPDFLPGLGAVDDAMVMGAATELAAEGLERYRTWKGPVPPG